MKCFDLVLIATLSFGTLCPLVALGDEHFYAAIAYSPSTGRVGHANGYRSEGSARAAAIRFCGAVDARAVVTVCNGWCALAIAPNGRCGIGYSADSAWATHFAMEGVGHRTSGFYLIPSR